MNDVKWPLETTQNGAFSNANECFVKGYQHVYPYEESTLGCLFSCPTNWGHLRAIIVGSTVFFHLYCVLIERVG